MRGNIDSISYFNENAAEFSNMTYSRPEFIERYNLFNYYINKYKIEKGNYLDLGAGNGAITNSLISIGDTTAIDGSEKMVNYLLENYCNEIQNKRLNVFQYSIPLPNEFIGNNLYKFDIVILSSVIEYIDDDMALLRQISKLLKKDGKLIISFPNSYSVFRVIEKYLIKKLNKKSYLHVVKRFYSVKSLTKLAVNANLKILEYKYFSLPYYKYLSKIFNLKRPVLLSPLGIAVFIKK